KYNNVFCKQTWMQRSSCRKSMPNPTLKHKSLILEKWQAQWIEYQNNILFEINSVDGMCLPF
ncbi:MAG: hypothetical protein ACRC7N_11370, partial [Clostridium sp.]